MCSASVCNHNWIGIYKGSIAATIRNTGSERGTFNAFASCSSPFSSTGNIQGSLEPGQARTINLPISGNTLEGQAQTTSSCVVNVESVAGTTTTNANVCVKTIISCTRQGLFCDGNEVHQCNVAQNGEITVESCSTNSQCLDGICVEGAQPTEGFFERLFRLAKQFFNNLFSDVFGFLRIFAGILSATVAFFLFDFLGKFKAFKGKKAQNIIPRLLIALAVGATLAFFLFRFIGSTLFWY